MPRENVVIFSILARPPNGFIHVPMKTGKYHRKYWDSNWDDPPVVGIPIRNRKKSGKNRWQWVKQQLTGGGVHDEFFHLPEMMILCKIHFLETPAKRCNLFSEFPLCSSPNEAWESPKQLAQMLLEDIFGNFSTIIPLSMWYKFRAKALSSQQVSDFGYLKVCRPKLRGNHHTFWCWKCKIAAMFSGWL
jgi:hypothetical protein